MQFSAIWNVSESQKLEGTGSGPVPVPCPMVVILHWKACEYANAYFPVHSLLIVILFCCHSYFQTNDSRLYHRRHGSVVTTRAYGIYSYRYLFMFMVIGADSTGSTGNFAPVLMKEPGQTLPFAPVTQGIINV